LLNWLRKLAKRPAPALTGAPAVRRQKTYSAMSGYVYQYHYEGMRQVKQNGRASREYVFNVSADRKTSFPVSVFLFDELLSELSSANGRELDSTERYALAKMSLFRAFDERETPEQMRKPVEPGQSDLDEIWQTLGL